MPGNKPVTEGFPGGFTVLMAVYDKDDPRLFGRALASVFDNDLQPDQVVLVVDGPVRKALDEQVRSAEANQAIEVVRLEKNKGLAAALNAGLAQVHTTWVVRADADDYNLPQRFRRMSKLIQSRPELDLAGSAVLELDFDGTPTAIREMPSQHKDIAHFLRWRNPFNHMTVAYRHGLVKRCGGYPDIHLREDYALWATMINAGARCANLPEVLVHATTGNGLYRRRGGFRYALVEHDIQSFLVALGVKSPFSGLIDGVARSLVFIVPVFLRRLIYKKLLRKSPATRS